MSEIYTIPEINLDEENQIEDFDFEAMHEDAFVDVSEELKPQPVAISIGTSEYKGKSYPIPFGSYGDFSCIVGASKAKKSFLRSLINASYAGGNAFKFSDNLIKGHDQNGKYLIDIDTEQSKPHSQRVFRRVCEMVGSNPLFYIPFYLRRYNPNERQKFIEVLMTKSKYAGNIGLVSIDGIADLVNDPNDRKECAALVQKLMTWTTDQQCHIMTVLHKNPGTMKPQGHLGSIIMQKAETVCFVEKEDNISIVTSDYSRNINFEQFGIIVNKIWLPEVVNDIPTTNKGKKDVPF